MACELGCCLFSFFDRFLSVHHVSQLFYNVHAARLAIQKGAAGIIVSNHGARQLDYVSATIMALEEVSLYMFQFTLCKMTHPVLTMFPENPYYWIVKNGSCVMVEI